MTPVNTLLMVANSILSLLVKSSFFTSGNAFPSYLGECWILKKCWILQQLCRQADKKPWHLQQLLQFRSLRLEFDHFATKNKFYLQHSTSIIGELKVKINSFQSQGCPQGQEAVLFNLSNKALTAKLNRIQAGFTSEVISNSPSEEKNFRISSVLQGTWL